MVDFSQLRLRVFILYYNFSTLAVRVGTALDVSKMLIENSEGDKIIIIVK